MPATPSSPWGSHAVTIALSLALAMLSGCATGTDDDLWAHLVVPHQGSARGGEVVALLGDGFTDDIRVWFGEAEADDVQWISSTELHAVTPTRTAGAVDVVLRRPGAEYALADGFDVLPIDLEFAEAPAHFVPSLEGLSVVDAVARDLDLDGDTDVLVAATGGLSTVLLNTGEGGFVDTAVEQPYTGPALTIHDWTGDLRALVAMDMDRDGDTDAFACHGPGEMNRLYINAAGHHFAERTRELMAPDGDDCRFAAPVDVDGDGRTDIAAVVTTPGGSALRIYRNVERDGLPFLEPLEELQVQEPSDGESCGSVVTSDAAVVGECTITREESVLGQAAGVLHYDFSAAAGTVAFHLPAPPLSHAPQRLELDLFGDASGMPLGLRVVDAGGETFQLDLGTVDWTGWARVEADNVASWPSVTEGGDQGMDLPLQWVAVLVSSGEAAGPRGDLFADNAVVQYQDGRWGLAEDFERATPGVTFGAVASSLSFADADGDGDPDVVAAFAGDGANGYLALRLNELEQFASDPDALPAQRFPDAGSGAVPSPPDSVVWVTPMDVDDDGDLDLAAISGDGQDRLLINDGGGHFFDDSFAAMPVDWADGRHGAAADMDLDGRLDLLIANHGAVNRLYRNRGDGGFSDATPALPLVDDPTIRILVLDVEGDGDPDVLAINDSGTPPRLYVSVEPPDLP